MYYYYHHVKEIPELKQIDERIKIAVEIFKGIEVNSFEAIKYLKLTAAQENSATMYIVRKAY